MLEIMEFPLDYKRLLRAGLGVPILIVLMISMVILPLPPFMLDILFTFNIAFALVVLLASVYVVRALEFAIFPTILLITTLLRLTLNIASARVVLLNGHTGTAAAGKVVESFGEVVIGGNYAVGLVIFAILIIINFVVVTKGAGRVSEVSARFTLDAMPGKQMAIDADLNAGLINAEEAKNRRQEIAREADFYGAMDGASKFIRGDAVAGILILFINIVGGMLIGMLQNNMNFSEAARVYALLTIGDGLVAQVPALLLSTAAAVMVTRVSSNQDMGEQVITQVFSRPKALFISALVLFLLGIIPGMPHIAFLGFAAILAFGGVKLKEKLLRGKMVENNRVVSTGTESSGQSAEKSTKTTGEKGSIKDLSWEDVGKIDTIGLEIGYRLIPMVDETQGGQLMSRIKGVRKKASQELGFLIPTVHIRDNLDLSPSEYRISLMGVPIGEGEVFVDKEMAINPGHVKGDVEGIPTKDPAFGLEALWIETRFKEQAQSLGFTVVDPGTVIATHLSQVVQAHSSELLGHDETKKLLDRLAEAAPKLVEELIPDQLSLSAVVRVLQALLSEGIPIRDMRTIAEALADQATRSKDHDSLLAVVRVALGRQIVQVINGMAKELPVVVLAPDLEQILLQTIRVGGQDSAAIEPKLAENIQASLFTVSKRQEIAGEPTVLLVAGPLRTLLARFLRHSISGLHVLSYQEVPDNRQIRIIGSVGKD